MEPVRSSFSGMDYAATSVQTAVDNQQVSAILPTEQLLPREPPLVDPVKLTSRKTFSTATDCSTAPDFTQRHWQLELTDHLRTFVDKLHQKGKITKQARDQQHQRINKAEEEAETKQPEFIFFILIKRLIRCTGVNSVFLASVNKHNRLTENSGAAIELVKLATRCLDANIIGADANSLLLSQDIELMLSENPPIDLSEIPLPQLERWVELCKFPKHPLIRLSELENKEKYPIECYKHLYQTIRKPFILGNMPIEEAQERWSNEASINSWLKTSLDKIIFASRSLSAANNCDLDSRHQPTVSIDQEQLYFGEENEFWPDQTCKEIGDEALEKKREQFIAQIEHILKAHDISYDKEVFPDEYGSPTLLQIGDWACKIFLDDDVIEVNTTPYRMNQLFHLSESRAFRSLTAYECFDHFIHKAATEMKMAGCSGHKHVDVHHALDGNPELLLRVILDMENAVWMARAFNRLDSSQYFFYSAADEKCKPRLELVVNSVNSSLANPKKDLLSGEFEYIQNLVAFFRFLGLNHAATPCNLAHISTDDFQCLRDIMKSPKSTLEFRQFHCPKNGEESRVINKLLTGRFNYLLGCHKQRKPLEYPGLQLKDFDEQQAAKAAVQFCKEAGLNNEEIQVLLRIPIPPGCL